MLPEGKSAILFELMDSVLRSWWTVVAGICVGLAFSTVTLHYSPKIYESSTKIFVASQRIPKEYIRTPVADDIQVRLRTLKEAVLSRPYLKNLIEKTEGLPASEELLAQRIGSIRSRVEAIFSRRAQLFEIRFRDSDPERAALVANTLAELYISENARIQASRAEETTVTLEELTADALEQLQIKENEINDYRHQNMHRTEAQLAANMQLLGRREDDLDANLANQAAVNDRLQKAQLDRQQEAELSIGPDANGIVPYASQVKALREELQGLLARYSANHPTVKAKQRELDTLLASGGDGGASETAGQPATPAPASPLDTQIASLRRQLNNFKASENKIRNEIAQYEQRIRETPRVQAELSSLTKGYDVLRSKYQNYEQKLETAREAQKIEEAQKGTRFEVIEKASASSFPLSPDPKRIYGVGFVAGLVLLVGPVLLKQFLKPVIGSEARLRELAEIPVLLSIPNLETPESIRRARSAQIKNIALSVASLAMFGVIYITMG